MFRSQPEEGKSEALGDTLKAESQVSSHKNLLNYFRWQWTDEASKSTLAGGWKPPGSQIVDVFAFH